MINTSKCYQAPNASWWQGRSDGPTAPRFHEFIKLIDFSDPLPKATKLTFTILGFCCDAGVKRNQGRTGAKEGPAAFRQAFGTLPVQNSQVSVYDAGNIICNEDELEEAQAALADAVKALILHGHTPIVIGGGHELAWGQYSGIAQAKPNQSHSIINFDAHYDMRPLLEGGKGSSGTPFTQIANHCRDHNLEFDYTCIGIQKLGNTPALMEVADSMGVHTLYSEALIHNPQSIQELITATLNHGLPIYLSICLDVFAACYAPGVSAPQPLGINPNLILPYLSQLSRSGKLTTIGIAELSPPYDLDNRTAKLTAQLISHLID